MALLNLYFKRDGASIIEFHRIGMSEKNLLGMHMMETKDIFLLAASLGLNAPEDMRGKKDGYFLPMKANCDDEIDEIKNSKRIKIEKVDKFILPIENSNRTIIIIRKNK